MSDEQWKRWLGRITSSTSFIAIIYEVITNGSTQPTLLLMLGMFAGLPIVINLENLLRNAATAATSAVAKEPEKPDKPAEVP
jgi:hypothetical protein